MKGKKESGKPIRVSNADFKREVLEAKLPVLVDFTAPWCTFSESLESAVESLASELEGLVKVAEIDVDRNNDVACQLKVEALPTLVLFYQGKEIGRAKEEEVSNLKKWVLSRLPKETSV